MANFKPSEFKIQQEKDVLKVDRVIKTDQPFERTVGEFQVNTLVTPGRGNYQVNRHLYGSLAATDEHAVRAQKDQRFSINPLLRDPLSIEQEERRVLEMKVQEQVKVLSAAATEKGQREGYAAGLEKGYAEAYQRFKEEAAERLAAIETFFSESETAKTQIFEANQKFVLDAILCVGRKLALKELSTDKEYVLRLARELILRTGARDQIRVRIHPDDAQTLELLKTGLEKQIAGLTNLNVETSQEVARGGVVVETEFNVLNGTLDTQFEKIAENLLAAAAPSAIASGGGAAT